MKNIRKWSYPLLILGIALLFTLVELFDNNFLRATDYTFSFSSFAINAFYVGTAIFIFDLLIEFWEKKYPWTKNPTNRFFLQLGSTLIVYWLFQSLIVFFIEPYFNQNQNTLARISLTYLVGTVISILVNLGYLIFYLKQKNNQPTEGIPPMDFLQGTANGKKVSIPKTAFFHFYIESGIVFGRHEIHPKVILRESLAELEKILDSTEYFRTNRKDIIAKSAIDKVDFHAENVQVLLKNKVVVPVSRRRVAALRKWLSA